MAVDSPPLPVEGADAAASLRPEHVAELGYLLRRVLDARAQYGGEHATARTALQKLHERLASLLQRAPTLTLEISPTQLAVAGVPLNKTAGETDPVAEALFADGARKLVLSRGLTLAQLATFLELAGRRRAADSDQSVMTDFWEAELPTVQFVVATTYAEEGQESLELAPDGRKTQRELVAGVMDVFTNADASASFHDELTAMIPLSASELEVLSASSLGGIRKDSLQAHDAAARDSVLALDPKAVKALRERLEAPRADAGARLLASHFEAAISAPVDLRAKVLDSLQRLFEQLLAGQRLAHCAGELERQLQLAKLGPEVAARRLPVLNHLRQALASSKSLEGLVLALDDPQRAAQAVLLLRVFGGALFDQLLDASSSLKTESGRQHLSKLLTLLNPRPELLLEKAKSATPERARELTILCNKLAPTTATPVLTALLHSPDAAIRRAAVRALDKGAVLGVVGLVRKMIGDPDREVRLVVVRLLAYAEDEGSVDAMNKLLARATTELPERRELYRALGEIGGVAAGDALTAEFNRQGDVEVRVSIAGAFGRAFSPRAAQALGELANKLLGNPKLRQACKAALAKAELSSGPGAPS